ncbi:hypothetical protein EGW08_015612 [Elysia chlorotica]|uniref:Uncharacterized protein n=1 Tax=Elysia chlorotica TaxID=188477 RepID=A0A3S1BWG4_ELYCH|nr:hypothetical protein EGW08_015612 [Elysia chlorotica]
MDTIWKTCSSLYRKMNSTKDLCRIFLIFWATSLPLGDAACTFPSQLSGSWVRSRDSKSLTFTSSSVSGLAVLYSGVDLGDFSCDTLSSGRYIIASGQFSTDFGQNKYYMCWQFVAVTDNSFLLYELTSDLTATNYQVRPGVTQAASAAVDASSICSKSTSTTLFTTLVKTGASESDVAATCPTSIQANFRYNSCSSASLQACTNTKYVAADYSICNEQVFGSAGGLVSCMGSAIYQGERYVNLFLHDSGNNVVCWKVPDTNTAGDMSSTYYSGDCTTTGGASTALTLVYSAACSTDSSSDNNAGGGSEAGDGGGGGSNVGVIVGAAMGGVALIALVAVLVYCLKNRGNKVQIVYSGEEPKTNGVKSHDENVDTTEETKVEMKIPEKTPSAPSGLPPIESSNKLPPGEALRG